LRMDDPADIAKAHEARGALGLPGGQLIANPIPEDAEIAAEHLAPIIARQIAGIISDISTDGTTVLLVEQNAAMALSLSDYAYIFRHGKVAQEGPSEELRADRDILELYLGGGTSGGTGGDTSESKTKSERS